MIKEPNFFIDTNVFIDYILGRAIIDKTNEQNFPLFIHLKQSVDLLEFCFKNRDRTRFCTSFLNVSEMPSVLIDSLVSGRMYRLGISFNYFADCRNKFLKREDFKKEVKETIKRFYEFLGEEKIWFMHNLKCQSLDDFNEINILKIDCRLPSLDALIFHIAKKEKGYFVTADGHFLGNKELKNAFNKEIEIISPHKALEIMKSLIKSSK